jgi:hypothetical protein
MELQLTGAGKAANQLWRRDADNLWRRAGKPGEAVPAWFPPFWQNDVVVKRPVDGDFNANNPQYRQMREYRAKRLESKHEFKVGLLVRC